MVAGCVSVAQNFFIKIVIACWNVNLYSGWDILLLLFSRLVWNNLVKFLKPELRRIHLKWTF